MMLRQNDDMTYQEQLDMNRIPQHVAIIMDGNGRWAQQRGQIRTAGHVKGTEVVKKIMENAVELGIRYLTLYTFSTENWNRPEAEINALMDLLFNNLEEEVFIKNQVRCRVIGEMDRLPAYVRSKVEQCIEHTKDFTRSCMVIALSYSSRWEITRSVKDIARKAAAGSLNPDDIDEAFLSDSMSTAFMPDPELLIRTGGEIRLSNFLLWQSAYTELYFTDVYWPDFNMEELCKAIWTYQQRQRRFGLTGSQIEAKNNN